MNIPKLSFKQKNKIESVNLRTELQPNPSLLFNPIEKQPPVKTNFIKRFWWVGLIIFIILIVLVGGFIKYAKEKETEKNKLTQISILDSSNRKSLTNAPDCPASLDGIFTSRYMQPADYQAITPLGNLNPPAHVFPTDHVYYYYHEYGGTDQPRERPIFAVADMTLYQIGESKLMRPDGTIYEYDYGFSFEVCKGLIVRMGHLDKLSKAVLVAAGSAQKQTDPNSGLPGGYSDSNLTNEQTTYDLKFKVKAGDIVGYAGGNLDGRQYAADLWTTYQDPKKPIDADPLVICPLNLLTIGELKTEAYNRLGQYQNGKFTPKTVEPLCGTIYQDKIGTVQGVWFEKTAVPDPKDARGKPDQLSLVHENQDPSVETISFGSDFIKHGKISFVPSSTSLVNRDFAQVKADGNLFCYQNTVTNNVYAITDKALVQLTDVNHLKIEQQSGTCGANESFISPFYYQR